KILEIPSRRRIALYVRPRTEHYVHTVFARLPAYSPYDLIRILRLPPAGNSSRRGNSRSGITASDAVISAIILHAQSVRTVRHAQRRYPRTGNGICNHEIPPRDQRRFFLCSEPGQELLYIHFLFTSFFLG